MSLARASTARLGKTAKVVYFASNREVHFEGKLSREQTDQIKQSSTEVEGIEVDEFHGEIVVREKLSRDRENS